VISDVLRRKGRDITYRPALAVGPFLTFQYIPVNVGNDSMGIHDVVADVRNSYVCIYCKLGLWMDCQ